MAEAEAGGAKVVGVIGEEKTNASSGHSDPIKNTLAGGFGGICLVAAGKFNLPFYYISFIHG